MFRYSSVLLAEVKSGVISGGTQRGGALLVNIFVHFGTIGEISIVIRYNTLEVRSMDFEKLDQYKNYGRLSQTAIMSPSLKIWAWL